MIRIQLSNLKASGTTRIAPWNTKLRKQDKIGQPQRADVEIFILGLRLTLIFSTISHLAHHTHLGLRFGIRQKRNCRMKKLCENGMRWMFGYSKSLFFVPDEAFVPEKRVLGIGSSPRRGGNSDKMLEEILRGCEDEGIETELVYLRDLTLTKCIGCEGCRKMKICVPHDDGMTDLYPKIIESQGLVLSSPTHHYNITTDMKTFIDRMYCFYDFVDAVPRPWSSRLAEQGRLSVCAAVCEQMDEYDMGFTMPAMTMSLEAFGYDILDTVTALGLFHVGKVKDHEHTLSECYSAGVKMAKKMKVE